MNKPLAGWGVSSVRQRCVNFETTARPLGLVPNLPSLTKSKLPYDLLAETQLEGGKHRERKNEITYYLTYKL
jgi:hypothetical protein